MTFSAAAIFTRRLDELSLRDVGYAGGKGADLGELTRAGFPVPPGFVVGTPALERFRQGNALGHRLAALLATVDVDDTSALDNAAAQARAMIESEPVPPAIDGAIRDAWDELTQGAGVPVAVRSSAIAEDAETFLNVRGADDVVAAVRRCWSSLFAAGAIFYRVREGLGAADADAAVVVQLQVRAARAGVMTTVDPGARNPDRVVIEGAFGLGESVESGIVSPDRYLVDKPLDAIAGRDVRRKELAVELRADGGTAERVLSEREGLSRVLADREVRALAGLGYRVEDYYGHPRRAEWALDPAGKIWLLQTRRITTSVSAPPPATGDVVVRGHGASTGVASGTARILSAADSDAGFADGDVIVARMTTADWMPRMQRAAAIVTDGGGMTCHAAIVARELGIPCVVGTDMATAVLRDGEPIVVDAVHGVVREGAAGGRDR